MYSWEKEGFDIVTERHYECSGCLVHSDMEVREDGSEYEALCPECGHINNVGDTGDASFWYQDDF